MNDEKGYVLIENLDNLITSVQTEGVVSRVFYKGEFLRGTLFGFDAGQELSEHTSTYPAVLHILEGQAEITLGNERHPVQAGSWVYMPPHLAHSIYAHTQLKMLLLLLESHSASTL
jgi:quercetin dioxygenase-like cupin family protein